MRSLVGRYPVDTRQPLSDQILSWHLPRLPETGLPARIVFAILESAGILYANLSPVIVSGLARLDRFSPETAGYVFSANMAGTALGGLLAIFLVRKLPWRMTSVILLLLLMVFDFASALTSEPTHLYFLRSAHGLCGGLLIGVSLAVIARMLNPERTISLFIMLQLIVGGTLTLLLTPLIATEGPQVIWFSLMGLSALALLLLPFLGEYPMAAETHSSDGVPKRAPWRFIIPAMLALLFYQAGEMAAFAFVIEIGLSHALELSFISSVVAGSLWVGGPAALFVTWWATRSGRLRPLTVSLFMMAAAVSLLSLPIQPAYLAANLGFGIFFSISFPYLMGVASELDNSGQMGAVAAFSGNLGLAIGPLVAGFLAADGRYGEVVMFGVAAIVAGWLLAVPAGRMLDQRNRTGKVIW